MSNPSSGGKASASCKVTVTHAKNPPAKLRLFVDGYSLRKPNLWIDGTLRRVEIEEDGIIQVIKPDQIEVVEG